MSYICQITIMQSVIDNFFLVIRSFLLVEQTNFLEDQELIYRQYLA